MEKIAEPEGGARITGKGMTSIAMKKLGERARELLNQAIQNAEGKIIKKHGPMERK